MGYEILPHTADLRIRAWGRDLEELFRSALAGLMAVLRPQAPDAAAAEERTVACEAVDTAALLVDFLSEALALAHIHREVYPEVRFETLSPTAVRATLRGVLVDEFDEDVKAATYHDVEARPTADGGWEATVVYDV